MTPLSTAPDFEPALDDLQAHLPFWWRSQDPSSELYKILGAIGSGVDQVSALWQQPATDAVLTAATTEGLLRNFQFAWGLQSEQGLTSQQLIDLVQALVTDDGSVGGLTRVLTALIAQPSGGAPLTFPPGNGVLDPSFAHDTIGSPPGHGWVTYGTNSLGIIPAAGPLAGLTQVAQAGYGNDLRLASASTATAYAPGETRVISAYVWIPSAWNGGQISLDNDFGGSRGDFTINGVGSGPIDANMALRDQWQRLATAITAGGSGFSGGVFIRAASAPTSGDAINISAAMESPGTELLPYGDGDQTNWAWLGPPGDSASEQGLVFPSGGGGLTLYEFPSGSLPELELAFPPDGSGLTFPTDGSGLTFGEFAYIDVQAQPGLHQLTVEVLTYLSFDRNVFARLVERANPADWLPPVIREVTSF